MFFSAHQILYVCGQIKKNKIGWACSTYGRQEWSTQNVGGET